jgi:transcription termination/antitermination protein NusG
MSDVSHESDQSATGWFVIWTESRAEKKVASRIEAQGMESWMPTVTERHRWSDRWKNVVMPLFPGYLFARGERSQLHRLLRTPGVLTVVKSGDGPAVLSDSFIASLRGALDRAANVAKPMTERHDYALDEEVVVQEGPLVGLRGVVQQFRGARHLVIWVREIGRGVAFTIGAALVARANVRDDIYA